MHGVFSERFATGDVNPASPGCEWAFYQRILWNVPLCGQKEQQLTDGAKVNAHNHGLHTVEDESQTDAQIWNLCQLHQEGGWKDWERVRNVPANTRSRSVGRVSSALKGCRRSEPT